MAATAFKLTDRSIVNTQGDNVGKHRSEKRGFQSVGRRGISKEHGCKR
jgi:hypothetical protein